MGFLSPEMIQQIVGTLPLLLMLVVFYFLFYRPQKKEQKKRDEMLNNLKKGDRIVTVGGIYGTITGFGDDAVTLQIAEKVEVKISRGAVSKLQSDKK